MALDNQKISSIKAPIFACLSVSAQDRPQGKRCFLMIREARRCELRNNLGIPRRVFLTQIIRVMGGAQTMVVLPKTTVARVSPTP